MGFPLGEHLRKKMLFELIGQKDKRREELPEEFARGGEDLQLLYETFAYGPWSSPDAFLGRHREFMQTGKYLICRCLAQYEQPWGVTQGGGWYDRLVRAISVQDPSQLKDNQLSIVTFNYDRSIDFRLHKYIERRFAMDFHSAWNLLQESIPIIHVHGTLGSYPHWSYGEQGDLWERSQDIKIISEVEDDTPEFRRASELLNNAERVVVFGFGFADDNVRRLRFFKSYSDSDIADGIGDERDILIATGDPRGRADQQTRDTWLRQWGLLRDRHHFSCPADTVFDHVRNPFE
jgi:hypothetical protein